MPHSRLDYDLIEDRLAVLTAVSEAAQANLRENEGRLSCQIATALAVSLKELQDALSVRVQIT